MDVSPERLRRFFSRVNNHYQVGKALRDLCIFSKHDLTRDPPFAGLDLVSCRNVMIYFDLTLQRRVLPLFHYALRPGGHLMLGASESIGPFGELFTLVERDTKVYKRNEAPTPAAPRLQSPRRGRRRGPEGERGPGRRPEHHRSPPRGRPRAAARYAPPGVLIDDEMTILQFRGHTGPFVEPTPGTASLDLTKMVRGGLSAELRAAVAEARLGRTPVRRKDLQYPRGRGLSPRRYRGHPPAHRPHGAPSISSSCSRKPLAPPA